MVSIQDESWSNAYLYRVPNGIKVIKMKMNKHLASKMNVAWHNVLVSYEGQQVTCYGCGHTGHMYQTCPTRCVRETKMTGPSTSIWAQIAAKGSHNRCVFDEELNVASSQPAATVQVMKRTSTFGDTLDTCDPIDEWRRHLHR
jgi:hypothetical protein